MKSSRARSLVLVAFGLCAGCGIELDELRTASMRAALGATPDLQVTALTGPTSALPSGSFHATATVCNQVAASTISATVSLYFSTDTTITTADTLLGSAPTGVLAGFQCVVLDIPVTAGSATGAWYLGAYVDPSNAVAETIETNNTRVGPRIFVGSKPDYTFTALTLPSAVQPSGSFKASTTVCNVGTTAAAGNVTVNLYLSADAGVSTSNPVAGSTSLPLAAGQCTSMDVSGTASGSAGAWYSSTIADPGSAISELNESNNSQSGAQLRVGSSPDFTITAATSPSGASSGSSVTTNITACNIGTTSGSASVSVYLSTDTTITTVDIMAGN
ncbi:MAG TPA: CARDB domain-containing protein, partial [Myxococcaceae bacterium]